jgi:hypothetical protein
MAGRCSGNPRLRLQQRPWHDHGFDEFVRHEETQRLLFAASRPAGVGRMNMGERLLAFDPALACAAELSDNASLMKATCPVISFLQKLLRLLHPKPRSSSGRIWPEG